MKLSIILGEIVMKKKLYDTLEIIQKVNGKYELKTLEEKIVSIHKHMEDFTLKILFVGEFSAGKSALINGLLKEELLTENQRPETAIASEIIYDTEEYIEAVKGDVKKQYAIEESAQINIKEYDFLIWHLNREELKKCKGCTIVDMPGFNSGIQEHNKAILRYAGRGNAYILVIDCEDGAIKQNMAQFIEEIKQYEDNIAIVITKTDLRTDEDVEQIMDNIRINAEMLFMDQVSMIATSKYDDNVGEKVGNLISCFDQERIFVQEFMPQVYDVGVRCIDSLEIYRKGMKLNLSQFDKEIEKHEKARKELSDKLKKEKVKLEKQFKNSVGPAILMDVQSALHNNTETLASSLKAGEKNFSMMVNNILRPVLLESTKQYVEQSFEQFITGIDFSGMDVDSSLQDIGINALEKYQQTNSKIQEIIENGDKFNMVYKTLTTTLAVVTSAIAPWLELIIIFLPDIFKLFGRKNREEQLRDKVNQIIPQIVEKLRPEIQKSLIEMQEEIVQQAEEEIGSMIDSEVESLKAAKESKEKASAEFDEKVQDVEQDIDKVKKALEQIA